MKIGMVLLVLLVGGSAWAVDEVDTLGFVVEGLDDAWGVVWNTSADDELVTLHLELANPSLGGVTGWEACVDVTGALINPVWTVRGTNVHPIPEPDGNGCFQVGISPLTPVEPGPSGLYRLATLVAAVPTPGTRVELRIQAVPGSTTFPETPGYAGPETTGLAPLAVRSAGADGPSFVINGEAPVGNETVAWSAIKTMFR